MQNVLVRIRDVTGHSRKAKKWVWWKCKVWNHKAIRPFIPLRQTPQSLCASLIHNTYSFYTGF